MTAPRRMKFGIFMAPFHRPGENPTLALERDLELIQWLDFLGFDEAYIGEHHSAGWEIIASPEVFIATAAERTRHIRLGTGVVSLPYHHPLMVANRMVLLDHLTRGRVILGVGPGALASDALMLGIPAERQREMMDEALGIIIRLFESAEPLTYKSDWFQLNDAVLQLRPYQEPSIPIAVASVQSPAGVLLAGKHGAGVLSLSIPRASVRQTSLKELWSIGEEAAAAHGKTLRREDWRLVVTCHLAQSRKEAIEDVRIGGGREVTEYFAGTLGHPAPNVPADQIVDYMVEQNQWIIGTPDDCIAGIERLQEMSGGFGGFLVRVEDWVPRQKRLQSYELLARYVMPHFQGTVRGIVASNQWARERKDQLHEHAIAGLKRATDSYFGSRN
ncbi:MAG TPA: LLM class flavin-dependent oxidoreductase [Alphaproteobacteria bacterium]|nr:LLM class flavin-dependent oxidoreductase [Alphaproteobacteria bacterium]